MRMRTKLLFTLFLVLILSAFFYFIFRKNQNAPQLTLYKQNKTSGQEQILTNDTAKNKKMTLNKTGIYEISTIAMKDTSAATTDPTIPPLGHTITGVYLSNEDSIEIPANTTVAFTPVSFKPLGSNKAFTLTKIGTYYVRGQIAPGKYHVTFAPSPNNQHIQLILSHNQKEEQVSELNNEKQTMELSVKDNSILSLKSNSFDVNVSFKRSN